MRKNGSRLAFLLLVPSMTALAAGAEAKVKLPASRADLAAGKKLFEVQCALCHGPNGEGARGPSLTRAKLSHAPDDAALLRVLEDGIRGTEMPGVGAMSDREVRQTAAYVRSLGKVTLKPVPGDPSRGAGIYNGKGNCAGCHSIHGEGGVAGPDLSSIGDSRSAAYLRESLLKPDAAVPEGFLLVTVVPNSGQPVTGARVNEDSFSIQIRDGQGRSLSFWKKDLAKIDRQRGKSPMPSYQGQLTEAELTDLTAYLASLKETK
jgi:cytochrome c oxidase cbb3-type subunit III